MATHCKPTAPSCLNASEGTELEWAGYLLGVYGEPVHPSVRRKLSWLWSCHLSPYETCELVPEDAPVSTVEPRSVRLSQESLLGEAYYGDQTSTDGFAYMYNWGFWVRRDVRHIAAQDHAWVEVMRAKKHDESWFNSTWYYVVRGTGIWMNVGRTTEMAIGAMPHHHVAQVEKARKQGFDTLQFTNAWSNNLWELVDLRPEARQDKGLTTCGTAELRTGFHAQLPCACDEKARQLNCGPKRRVPHKVGRREHRA
jgi:hypothetical protein